MRLSDDQIDTLTEIVNIGVGRAAASLSRIIGERVALTVPCAHVGALSDLSLILAGREEELDTAIVQDFEGNVSGRALLAFPTASGITLAQIISGVDETIDELDVDLGGILEEVGNNVLNAVLGSIGNMINVGMVYTVPEFHTATSAEELICSRRTTGDHDCDYVLVADAQFHIDHRDVGGSLLIAFDMGAIDLILTSLNSAGATS